MNAVLKFAIVDLPNAGLDDALQSLRNGFSVQLNRFPEVDLSNRTESVADRNEPTRKHFGRMI
jgi:hypothetical protein